MAVSGADGSLPASETYLRRRLRKYFSGRRDLANRALAHVGEFGFWILRVRRRAEVREGELMRHAASAKRRVHALWLGWLPLFHVWRQGRPRPCGENTCLPVGDAALFGKERCESGLQGRPRPAAGGPR